MEKGKKLEWLMAVILLSAAYVLSREGARQHRRQPQK